MQMKKIWPLAIFFLLSTLPMAALLALPALQRGVDAWTACRQVFTTAWCCYVLLAWLLFITALFSLKILIVARSSVRRSVGVIGSKFVRPSVMRIFLIILVILFITQLVVLITVLHDRNSHMVATTAFNLVIVLIPIISLLFQSQIFPLWKSYRIMQLETQQQMQQEIDKEFDERSRLVEQKSALSTLFVMLMLIGILGSLYDILITRQLPIRSYSEMLLLFIIWMLAYRYWEKRM